MKYIIDRFDQWGYFVEYLVIYDNQETAEDIVNRYDKVLSRIRNLDTETLTNHSVEILLLAKSLLITEREVRLMLKSGDLIYCSEVKEVN